MKPEEKLHDKAIRLAEGGIVKVEGHYVALGYEKFIYNPCYVCEMDCLCHQDNAFCDLCLECDLITKKNCFLVLKDNKQ